MTNKNCDKRNIQDKNNKNIHEIQALKFFRIITTSRGINLYAWGDFLGIV